MKSIKELTRIQKREKARLIGAILFSFLVVVAACVMAGNADYHEEAVKVGEYCEMVKNGHWPDYDKSIDCGGVQ